MMDRETRKANLKKLQLPSTSGYKQRRTRQTAKTAASPNTAIKNYFLTPEKNNHPEDIINDKNETTPTVSGLKYNAPKSSDINLNIGARTSAKRTKLDAFIFKNPNNIPNSIKTSRKSLNDEDFVLPEKKAKKAPKLKQAKSSKSSRTKKQTTIKSAFLRNEQLFAEIAAQHCAAEKFDGDQVQLALAISKSEAECKGIVIVDENAVDDRNGMLDGDNEAESIREKLKKYGFRTAEKKDYNTFAAAFLPKINNRKSKSKWANKFTSLTLRSSENQMKKLQENIEKVLNSQFCTKPLSDQEKNLPHYKVQSSLLRNSAVHERKIVLQATENMNQSNELFFVAELFEINQLPAGYLLKDWAAIQGRDLTPNAKNKQSKEMLKILETIYQDLEEFFSSRKRLDWTAFGDDKEDQEISTNKKGPTSMEERQKECSPEEENMELNEMVKLIECLQKNEEFDNEKSETDQPASACDNKILQLLPATKSLDTMQVSSCSINTQGTIYTTQKTRSNSPDLFADSDAEMELADNMTDQHEKREETVHDAKDMTRKNSLDCIGDDVITYEIFSSDEVKNTSLVELNKPALKELSSNNCPHTINVDLIDLTQNDLQLSRNNISNNNFNQSKPIEEIDLFAESPLQEDDHNTADINISSQHSKYVQENEEVFECSPSTERNHKKRQTIETKMQDPFKHSSSSVTQEQFDILPIHHKDDDIILCDESFLNFQGSKQLETSFHRKTTCVENDTIENNLTADDTIFRDLCNKYLNHKAAKSPAVRELQKIDDFSEDFSQMLPNMKTPQKCNNFTNFTMDFNMTVDNFKILKRKSTSFAAKTPLKFEIKDTNTILPKSQSFNKHHSNASIDLTQNDVEGIEYENDDDCLVLSDDEINYSIWQANKSLHFHNSAQSNQDDIESLPDDNEGCSDVEKILEFPSQHDNDNKKISYLQLEDSEKSLIKINLGPEQSISDFEILTSKYDTLSKSPTQDEPKLDRSEFGILEEYSQPIDYTPNLCTPTKVLTEDSLLGSPTETSAPMKLYSNCHRSSQKFQDLINNIEAKSPPYAIDDFSNFDEFDRLVSTSSLKSVRLNKKPHGIDQLLTAEISFKESQKLSETKKDLHLESSKNKTQEIKCNNKVYTVRYILSPKPKYSNYTDAELLKELYNFGIKPLKRTQAVKMLDYIYNQTHPILIENKEESVEKKQDVITSDDFERPSTSKEALNAKSLISKSNESKGGKEGDINLIDSASNKLNLQDSCGLEMLRYSIELKAELSDENYILQTNVTKKTPQPLLPFHIAWYNLVCSNRKLHENILMYEPIDLQEVYLFLKSLGYRYDPKELKYFFDRRCIIFRYDLASATGNNDKMKHTNRHVRKSKKKTIKSPKIYF